MGIELLRVTEDLRSVLRLSEHQLEVYRKCLEAIKWLNEGKETLPKMIKDGGTKEIKSTFVEIIEGYLGKIGLMIGRWSLDSEKQKVYFRPDNTIDIDCQGIKIMPGRENVLDGFKPELKFFINPKTPSEIEVACQLKREGMYLLSYLIKPTLLHYLPGQNNGLNSPLAKMVKGESITIASIGQISKFLKDMKTVAQCIDREKLGQLEQAEKNITLACPELKEAAKGIYALTFLKILGKEI